MADGRSKMAFHVTWSMVLATDAPFDGYSDLAAILSHIPSPLLNQAFVHVTGFMQTRWLGPERGWSIWKRGNAVAFTIVTFVASVHSRS